MWRKKSADAANAGASNSKHKLLENFSRTVSRLQESFRSRGNSKLCDQTSPGKAERPVRTSRGVTPPQTEKRSLLAVCIANVKREIVKWVLHPFLALRKVIVLTGEEGIGKTWLICAIAAAVTRGSTVPHVGTFLEGNVLMLTTEDGLADTLRPRLEDCGADLSRVFACDEVFTLDQKGLKLLENLLAEHKPILVTIDSIFGYVDGKANINQDNVLRSFMAPLKLLAERHNCAIVLVRHLNKAKGYGDSRAAGLAGIGLRAAARLELFAGKNPDDESDRALIVDKSNLAPRGAAVGYKIDNNQFSWKDSTTLTVNRILANASNEEDRAHHAEAVSVLGDLLVDGEQPAEEVKREMRNAGFSNYAIRKAQRELRIKPRKTGGEFGGKGAKWVWEVPAQDVELEGFENLVINVGDNDTCINDLAQDAERSESSTSCERNGNSHNAQKSRPAIWHNKDHDQPIVVTGDLGEVDGKRFYSIAGSSSGIPEDQIEFV